jgi:recombination protein RecT
MSDGSTVIKPWTPCAQAVATGDSPKKIRSVAADHLDFERYLAMAVVELNKPELAKCHPPSAAVAAMNCAVIGLMPGSMLGHAFFVPFRNKKHDGREEVQVIVGYKGYLDLAMRSGFLAYAHPELILAGETFRLWNDIDGCQLEHELTPRFAGQDKSLVPDKGNIVSAYCIYRTKTGVKGVVGITRAEINKIDSGRNVWRSDFPSMCRKSAILRARKEWRVTIDFDRAELLDAAEAREEAQPLLVDGEVVGMEDETRQLSLGDLPATADEAKAD